jgi:hypothetical protein
MKPFAEIILVLIMAFGGKSRVATILRHIMNHYCIYLYANVVSHASILAWKKVKLKKNPNQSTLTFLWVPPTQHDFIVGNLHMRSSAEEVVTD